MKQRTISKSIEVVGIGLHSGKPVKMKLEPVYDNIGIVFFREDLGVSIPLKIENVGDTKMATELIKGSAKVKTIEHLLSAIYAYGIDNLKIILDNEEIPILDGSSSGYCMLIDDAGISTCETLKQAIKVKKMIEVKDGKKFARLTPSNNIVYDFEIDFDHPSIGNQKFKFDYSIGEYKESISKARTFGFLHELQYLNSIGLAKGASLENVIGLDEHKILNREGLRYDNEFVRHKILDAIGDMALLNYTLIGKYEAFASSHHINHILTKELFKNEDNYEIFTLSETDDEKSLEVAYAKY